MHILLQNQSYTKFFVKAMVNSDVFYHKTTFLIDTGAIINYISVTDSHMLHITKNHTDVVGQRNIGGQSVSGVYKTYNISFMGDDGLVSYVRDMPFFVVSNNVHIPSILGMEFIKRIEQLSVHFKKGLIDIEF